MSTTRSNNIFDPFSLDLLDPFFGSSGGDTAAVALTLIDWKETPAAHVFTTDLPGVKKEEVKVEVEDGRVLRISGETQREAEEKSGTWHLRERCCGKFFRRFQLPENAKVDEVTAAMDNGVLTLTVPKEGEDKKVEVRSIRISG